MNLVVIRHGETDMNKDGRLQGSQGPNLPLNDTGRAQIAHIRDGLLLAPSHIYASPLRRTQETAAIINERFGVKITLTDRLLERDFGSLSGKLRAEIDPRLVLDDLEGHYDYRPYGGESARDVRARILEFLTALPLASDENICAVTHRGVIRILYDLYPDAATGNEIIPGSLHIFQITKMPAG